jgi:hypothetical protein
MSYKLHGILVTSCTSWPAAEIHLVKQELFQGGRNRTVWILQSHAATTTHETRPSQCRELFQHKEQGDIFNEIYLPSFCVLRPGLELPLWWDPGGEEFAEYFMQTAEGGRNNKSTAYCVDQFFCFNLTCSFQQVPVSHKFYFNFDQVHADSDYTLDHASFFDLAQVNFHNGYHNNNISTKECRVTWDPGGKGSKSAWGQVEFQGGRSVSEPILDPYWAGVCTVDGLGPIASRGGQLQIQRGGIEASYPGMIAN